jgi:hypothetical protein
MRLISQITVFLENQPGTMAKVCRLMKQNNINIDAFTLFGTVDHGVLRMVVDRCDSAVDVLGQCGLLAIKSNVIEVLVKNEPGVLFEISELLSSEDVNIEYGYGSTGDSSGGDRLYLQASETDKALGILEKKLSIKK